MGSTTRRAIGRPRLWKAALLAMLASLGVMPRGWSQEPPPIEWTTNSPLLVGTEEPVLEITTSEHLEDVRLRLRGPNGTQEESLGLLARGHAAAVALDAPVGFHEWRGEMEGRWRDAPFALSFEFEFEVSEGLEVSVPLDRVDLEARRLALVLSRPADHVDYLVVGEDGGPLGSGTIAFGGEPPGAELVVPWTQSAGNVLKIVLTAHDTSGFWSEVEIVPWSFFIPHEEVHFATDSDVIETTEEPKIDDAFGAAMEAARRYGQFVEIRLYVAGYTDTVGSRPDNQDLSERRARSIGRAFRERGFDYPIFYQGFGEDVLAASTPDGTDDVRNRRALYILAAQPPISSSQIPRANWRPID